jgi:hypothetical protein
LKTIITGQTLQESCAEARRAVLQVEPVRVAHWFLFAVLIWPFPPVMEQQASIACSGLSFIRVITGLNFGLIFIFSGIGVSLLEGNGRNLMHFQELITRAGDPHDALLRLH